MTTQPPLYLRYQESAAEVRRALRVLAGLRSGVAGRFKTLGITAGIVGALALAGFGAYLGAAPASGRLLALKTGIESAAAVWLALTGVRAFAGSRGLNPEGRSMAPFVLVLIAFALYEGFAEAGDLPLAFTMPGPGMGYHSLRQNVVPWLAGLLPAVGFLGFSLGLRFSNVPPVEFQVAWLMKVLRPLLDDAPRGAPVNLLMNPYQAMWSAERLAPLGKKSGYTYERAVDKLLEFEVRITDDTRFEVTVDHEYESKTKNRKNKYKGTKHRLLYEFKFQSKAYAAATPDARAKHADAVKTALAAVSPRKAKDEFAWRDQGDLKEAKLAVRVTEKALVVRIVDKVTAFERDLEAKFVMDPALMLAYVHTASRFA